MKNILFIVLLLSALLLGCSQPSRLEQALQFAGENRAELEKVLVHYSQNTEDSLKYKAACFLIENMPYHYYYDSDELTAVKEELCSIVLGGEIYETDVIPHLEKKYGSLFRLASNKKNDAQTISADYIIQNIEQSFGVWKKQVWGKNVSFQTFCSEILPYRIGDEALEDWRETYISHFQPLIDSLLMDDDPISAAQILYDEIVGNKGYILHSVINRVIKQLKIER